MLAEAFLKRYSEEFDKDIRGFSNEAKRQLNDNLWPGNVRELENAVIRAVINADSDIVSPDLLAGDMYPAKPEGDTVKVGMTLDEAEKELIVLTLKQVNGHKGEAARMLGLSRKGFYNKLKKYDL